MARNRNHRSRGSATLGILDYPGGTNATASPSVAGSSLRLNLSEPVIIQRLPVEVTVNGAVPTAMEIISDRAVNLTYAIPPAAGQTVRIPARIPQIRTRTGGYLNALTYELPEI
jgi:hypothetical protein